MVQRGNNRLPCFLDDIDRRRYLHLLGEALLETGCALHAYVLMDNHVHLLLSPPEIGSVSRLMQKLGHGYVDQFNARHRRTGATASCASIAAGSGPCPARAVAADAAVRLSGSLSDR